MPLLEIAQTAHFAIVKEGPGIFDTTTKCTGIFNEPLDEWGTGKKIMVTHDEFRDQIVVDVEAGENAVAAILTLRQAEALVKELNNAIDDARNARF
jgi:hypothetical protein